MYCDNFLLDISFDHQYSDTDNCLRSILSIDRIDKCHIHIVNGETTEWR